MSSCSLKSSVTDRNNHIDSTRRGCDLKKRLKLQTTNHFPFASQHGLANVLYRDLERFHIADEVAFKVTQDHIG